MPTQPLDFIDGLRTMVVNGDADAQTGVAAHLVLCNRSMERAFVNSDGEMLLVPQQGRFTITTELGVLEAGGAGRDRAAAARPGLQRGGRRPDARLCLRKLRRAFRLPELGPIGSNGLANPRDFLAPVAAFDAEPGAWDRQEVRRPALEARVCLTRPSTSWPGTATWRPASTTRRTS
jgi:homogentisate 1,2-dioxygenase